MKVVSVQGYFVNNLGDDLFLKVLSDRFPNANFHIKVKKIYSQIYRQINSNLLVTNQSRINRIMTRMFQPLHLMEKYTNFDAIVEIGGSIFQQQTVNEKISSRRQYWAASGVPYFVIGSNFGPVLSSQFVSMYRKFFSQISGVTFRDKNSYNKFLSLPNVQVAPDPVFNLDISRIRKFKSDRPYVVITPIDVKFPDRVLKDEFKIDSEIYFEQMTQIAESFIGKNFDVVLIPFSSYEGDKRAALDIKQRIKDENEQFITIKPYTNIMETLSIMKGASFLVSGRFHSMILGWLCSVPQLVIKYSSKTANVIEDLYPNQFSINLSDLANLNTSSLINQMNTMPESKLIQTIEESKKQFDQVSKVIGHS